METAGGTRTLGTVSIHSAPVPDLERPGRSELQTDVDDLYDFVDLHDEVTGTRGRRLVVLAVLNALDLITTTLVLAAGGGEANPVLVPVAHLWWAPLLVKAGIFSVVMWAILRVPIRSQRSDRMIRATCAFYVGVVVWNLAMLAGWGSV